MLVMRVIVCVLCVVWRRFAPAKTKRATDAANKYVIINQRVNASNACDCVCIVFYVFFVRVRACVLVGAACGCLRAKK